MSQRDLRVAVIGAGMMGEAHARAARRCGATIVAIADNDAERARALGARMKVKQIATAPDQIISLSGIDAFHVCTPPEDHYSLCRRILSANRNVMCEKPLAASSAEVSELVSLASANGVTVCPVHQFPFQRGVKQAVDASDELGKIVHLSAEMFTAGAVGRDEDGMSALALDIVTHALSLFRTFGAAPLAEASWQVMVPKAGELLVTGASSGVGLSVVISTSGRPTSNILRVVGTRGTATIDLYHGFSVIERGAVSRRRKAARPFTSSLATLSAAATNGLIRGLSAETEFPGLRALVGAFYDALEKKAATPIPPEEIIDISVARDRIVELSRGRSPEP